MMNILKENNCRKMFKFFLMVLIFSGYCLPIHAEEPAGVTVIRSLYQDAGRKIGTGEFPKMAIGFKNHPSGSTKLYWDPGNLNLVKVVKDQPGDKFSIYTEYLYYPDGNLAFIFERTTLPDNRGKQENRYYMEYENEERKLIRYILSIDSNSDVFDSGLEMYEKDLIPFSMEAESLAGFFNTNIKSLLSNIARGESEVNVSLEHHDSSGKMALVIEMSGNKWEFTLGTEAGFYTGEGHSRTEMEFSQTGTVSTKYYGGYNQETGIIYASRQYLDSSPPPINNVVEIFNLSLGLTSSSTPEKQSYGPANLPGYIVNSKLFSSINNVTVSFHSQQIFNSEDLNYLIETESVPNPYAPFIYARINRNSEIECVEILMEVYELAVYERPGIIVEDGFDIYRVNMESKCEANELTIKRIEWISAGELKIITSCGEKDKEYIAVLGPEISVDTGNMFKSSIKSQVRDSNTIPMWHVEYVIDLPDYKTFNNPYIDSVFAVGREGGTGLGGDNVRIFLTTKIESRSEESGKKIEGRWEDGLIEYYFDLKTGNSNFPEYPRIVFIGWISPNELKIIFDDSTGRHENIVVLDLGEEYIEERMDVETIKTLPHLLK